MPNFLTDDGAEIYYKDWGSGDPIVFSHGWPLSADAWDAQMFFFGGQGYRVVAHDRRGHGRSSQTWDGNDYDTWADDLSGLIDQLDLRDVTLVAHSMGGGEIARYVGRHGTSRLARMVFIGAVPPLMLQTDANPGGLPQSVFDGLRAGSREPIPVLQGHERRFLQLQQAERQSLGCDGGSVLAPWHAVGYQGVL